MSNYFMYRDQMVCKVGEVAVHNMPGTPEVHFLFRSGHSYLTMNPNDMGRFMQPVESVKLVEHIDNERKVKLVTETLEIFNGPFDSWANRSRKRELVRTRQLFVWALRISTTMSLDDCGKRLSGSFDHSTVIHAIKAIEGSFDVGDAHVIKQSNELAARLYDMGCEKLSKHIKRLIGSSSINTSRQRALTNKELMQ